MSDSAAPLAAVKPDVVGYVEATTGTRILGWAWAPGQPQLRLRVQALLDDAVVAEAVADRARDDLARNGIGDGRHAFEVTLPDHLAARIADLRVVARLGEGDPSTLGAPAPPEGMAERLDRLQRSVDLLVGSQRLLHRNLQTVMMSPSGVPPEPADADDGRAGVAAALAATQADLGRQMATLELFAMRLDERLAALAPAAAGPSARGSRATGIALAVVGLVMAASAWGLLHALAGAVAK